MNKRDYKYIFDEFKMMCPWAVPNAVSWKPGDDKEVIVQMSDGSVISYDYILKAFRSAPSEEELYSRRRPTNEEEWRRQFSIRLYKKMYMKGYTQEELSWRTGISQSSLAKYVNGLATPNSWTINRLAKELGCSTDDLIHFD